MGRRSAVGTMSRAEGGGWDARTFTTDAAHPGLLGLLPHDELVGSVHLSMGLINEKRKTHSRDDDIDRLHYTTLTTLHYGSTHTQYTRYVILRDRLPRDSPRSDPCSSSCSCSLPRPVPRHGPWSGLFFFVGALANSQQVWQTLHVYFFTLVSWSVVIKYIFYIPIPIPIPRR